MHVLQTFVLEGGSAMTIESQEVSRKHKLLVQLKIARRLRAVMEQASREAQGASLAEKRKILIQHKGAINELVALTQAVRGNYTLDSYHTYSAMYEKKEKLRRQEFVAAVEVIRSHLRDWTKERDPNFIDGEDHVNEIDKNDAQLESSQCPASTNCVNDDKSQNELISLDQEFENHQMTSIKETNKTRAAQLNYDIRRSKSSTSQRRKKSKLEPKKPSKVENSSFKSSNKKKLTKGPATVKKISQISGRAINPTTKLTAYEEEKRIVSRKKRSMKGKKKSVPKGYTTINNDERKPVEAKNKNTSSSLSKAKSGRAHIKKTSKAKILPRKCHYCKNLCSEYLRCHFFFVNGNKCGKIFCKECMISKFQVIDYNTCVGDSEWHCPSCLGQCDCTICVKNRARIERHAVTPARRSKTRAAENSSYLF